VLENRRGLCRYSEVLMEKEKEILGGEMSAFILVLASTMNPVGV
jgi:hypothetical protein